MLAHLYESIVRLWMRDRCRCRCRFRCRHFIQSYGVSFYVCVWGNTKSNFCSKLWSILRWMRLLKHKNHNNNNNCLQKMVQKSQSYTIRAHNTLTDIQLCQWINEIRYVQSQCWLRRSHSKWKFLPLADASVYRTHNNWLRHRQACMLPFKETSSEWMHVKVHLVHWALFSSFPVSFSPLSPGTKLV